jgi:hypothetical protein
MKAKFRVGVIWSSLIGVSLALVASCQKDQPAAAAAGDVSGLYRLVSVDGKKMPAVITHEDAKLEIRSGSMTINNDGTCLSKMVFVPPSGTEGTREVNATYTRNGAKFDMEWKDAGKTTGTLEGSTFTMNNEGMVLVYRK